MPDEQTIRGWVSERWRSLVVWLLLTNATFHVVTNGFYLRLLEPAVSRRSLTVLATLIAATAFAWDRPQAPSFAAVRAWLRGHLVHIALALVVGVAFYLRLWGIEYGLPQSYISDEYDFVHSYLTMLKRGDFNPHWWIHPSLQAYVNVVSYVAVFMSQVASGRWHSIQELSVEEMLFWGRFGTGVIPGTAVILVTFFLGRRMFSAHVGLAAAALMAVFPGAVEWSQYNKPDPLLAFMAPLSFLAILKYFDEGGRVLAFGCGVLIGLTAAAKYNGGFVLLSFALAVALRHRSHLVSRPDLYLGGSGTVVGFFLGCPYWFSEFPRFVDHVADALYNYGYAGWPGATGSENWYFHAHYAVTYGTGPLAFLAAIVGVGVLLHRLDARRALFLSFPLLYYAYYSSKLMNFPGNLICIYPFIALVAVIGIRSMAFGLSHLVKVRRYKRFVETASLTILFAITAWLPTRAAIAHNVEWNRPDTGNLARLWIEANIPPNSHLAVERQTPYIDAERYRVTVESRLINRAVRDYRADGVQYLVVSSAQYLRYGPEHRQTLAYEKLFAICPLIKEFAPLEGRIIGPTMRILQVPAQ